MRAQLHVGVEGHGALDEHVVVGHGAGGHAAAGLPVGLEAAGADVLALALRALVGPLVGVQAPVQLEVHELRELGRAVLAVERLLPAVQPHVGLQVARAAEPEHTATRL